MKRVATCKMLNSVQNGQFLSDSVRLQNLIFINTNTAILISISYFY
jgi:hypothetical protein